MYSSKINLIEKELFSFSGKHFVSLSTTANLNNPGIHFTSIKNNKNLSIATFIFKSLELLPKIISTFDGKVDAFLIDVEVKNSVNNLEEKAKKLISKSAIIKIKPNDMTCLAFDSWINNVIPDFSKINVLIVSLGNLGFKIALSLVERGASVKIFGRNKSKLSNLKTTIDFIKSGKGKVDVVDENYDIENIDLVVGASPGVPVISLRMIKKIKKSAIIVDLGNGTLFPESINYLNNLNLKIFCISSEPGIWGWYEAHKHSELIFSNQKKKELDNGLTLISPGILGSYGHIIVDNPNNWNRVIGVCDGKGDVLNTEKSEFYIKKLKKLYDDKK